MKFTLSLSLHLLKAASLAMAKKDSLTTINGVYFNPHHRNLNATNRHIAFFSQPNTLHYAQQNSQHIGFIMPASLVEQIAKVKAKPTPTRTKGEPEQQPQLQQNIDTLTVEFDSETEQIYAKVGNQTFSAKAETGHYPELSRTYLKELDYIVEASPRGINSDYLLVAAQITKTLKPLWPTLTSAELASCVTCHEGKTLIAFEFIEGIAQLVVMKMQTSKPFEAYALNHYHCTETTSEASDGD